MYKFVVEANHHIDKRWRYTLGASLESSVLELISEVIMAKHAPRHVRVTYLLKAGAHLEIIRFKLRACLELEVMNETQIFQAQSHASEIGRMLGGWIKSSSTP